MDLSNGANIDIGQTLAVVGISGWRCCVCNATFPRAFSIEHHMITAHTAAQSHPEISPAPCVSGSGQKINSDKNDVALESICQQDSPVHSTEDGSLSIANNSALPSDASPPSSSESKGTTLQTTSEQPGLSQSSKSPSVPLAPVAVEFKESAESQPEEMEGIEARFDCMCVTRKQLSELTSNNVPGLHQNESASVNQKDSPVQGSELLLLQKPEKNKKRVCECGQMFDTKHDIKQHHKASGCRMKGKAYICPVCSEGFAYKRGLNRHLAAKGDHAVACPDCNLRFHSHHDLQTHREHSDTAGPSSSAPTHPPEDPLQKAEGNKHQKNTGQPSDSVEKHKSQMHHHHHHPAVASAYLLHGNHDEGRHLSAGSPWECPKCKKHFFRKCVYRNHLQHCGILKVVAGQRSFHCPLCGSVFRWLVHLQRHYSNHHKTHSTFSGADSPGELSPFSGNSPAPSADTSTTNEDAEMILSESEDLKESNTLENIGNDVSSASLSVISEGIKDNGKGGTLASSHENQQGKSSVKEDDDAVSVQKDDSDDVIVVSDSYDDSDSLDSDIEWLTEEQGKDEGGKEKADSPSSQSSSGFDPETARSMFWASPPWRGAFWGMRGMRGHGHHHPPPPPFHPPPQFHGPLPPPPPPPGHHSPPPPYDSDQDHANPGDQRDWGGFNGFHHFPGHPFYPKHKWMHCMWGPHHGRGFMHHGPHFHGWHHGKHPFHRHGMESFDPKAYASEPSDFEQSCPRTRAPARPNTSQTVTTETLTVSSEEPSKRRLESGCFSIGTSSKILDWVTKPAGTPETKDTSEKESLENASSMVSPDSQTTSNEQKKIINQVIDLITSSCEERKKIWYCPDCLRAFEKKKILKDHHEGNHTSSLFPCLICGKQVPCPVKFNKHIRHQHAFQWHRKGGWGKGHWLHRHGMRGKGWSPDIFNRMFSHPHFAEMVTSSLAGDPDKEGYRECPYCKKRFRITNRKENFFERHVNSHLGIDMFNYKCKICGKTFLEKSKFESHKASHCSAQQYVCTTCGKSYQNKTSLTRHERIHTGERPHKCLDCGKGFFEHRELARHRATHTGQAAFECPECRAGFTLRASLLNHMRYKHTGEKPFSCDACTKGFSSSSALARHRKTCAAATDSCMGDGGTDAETASRPQDVSGTVTGAGLQASVGQVKEEPVSMELESS